MTYNGTCPIWETPVTVAPKINGGESVDSPRAGGKYSVSGSALAEARWKNMNNATKARLTTWLIDQRELGTECPKILSYTMDDIEKRQPLPVHERADRLLRYLEQKSPAVGRPVECGIGEQTDPTLMEMLAWSESLTVDELLFLAEYLVQRGWIDKSRNAMGKFMPIITVDGYTRLAEIDTKHVNSKQGFVAMWFDKSMKEAYEKGIGPGIEDAGYSPLPINRKEHINKIDDEIIAEIRRSRFIVSDFTHKEYNKDDPSSGIRGGVYYEAGFAHGLNIPVFFTCRNDIIGKIHFDTRQYNHIVWKTPEDLRKQLANRISAVVGDGPNKQPPK